MDEKQRNWFDLRDDISVTRWLPPESDGRELRRLDSLSYYQVIISIVRFFGYFTSLSSGTASGCGDAAANMRSMASHEKLKRPKRNWYYAPYYEFLDVCGYVNTFAVSSNCSIFQFVVPFYVVKRRIITIIAHALWDCCRYHDTWEYN